MAHESGALQATDLPGQSDGGLSLAAEPLRDRLRARWRGPRSFTAVVPMPGLEATTLHARLARLDAAFQATLGNVGDLHSFRLVAVPPDAKGGNVTRLLVNSVHDLPLGEHLPALFHAAGPLLDEALAGVSAPAGLLGLLLGHRVHEQTLHLGAIGQSVRDILGERRLREAVQSFVDARIEAGAWGPGTPAETIRQEVRAHVLAEVRDPDVPRDTRPPLPLDARALRLLDLLASFAFPAMGVLAVDIQAAIQRIADSAVRLVTSVAYALWWVYGAIPTAAALLWVRFLEAVEPDVVAPAPDEETLQRLEWSEDLRLKNAVTLWFPVKPTWARRVLLWVILWGSERGCRHVWTDGRLSGIETIHYARIMQLDGGLTLLFMSDYDGGLNRYLDDFLSVGSQAVIPISSNADGCPKTRWLFRQADPDTFGPRWRGLIRRYQLEMAVWYNAYPLLTVREILANARLRERLFAPSLPEAEARLWARGI